MVNEKINDEKMLSRAMYILKAFAVVSIVLAHTSFENISNEYIKVFLSIYKLIGVYLFFISSGYFYNTDKYKNILELLKDKSVKIGVPWLLIGTLIYVITILFNNSISINIKGFINHLLGNGTYLYFLTMLIMCYIITYFWPKKYEYILIGLNMISILLTMLKIFPQDVSGNLIVFTYLNPYLNVFNWIGVFAIGILLKRREWLIKIKDILYSKSIYIIAIYVVIYSVLCFTKINITYWNLFTLIWGIVSFLVIISLSLRINECNILIDIGKKSFFVYLVHALTVSVFRNVLVDNNIFAIIRPVVIVIVTYVIAAVGQYIAIKVKLEKIYNILLGIR